MSNTKFFEAVAPFYSEIYFEVDAPELVRQWVQLFEAHGLIPDLEKRIQGPLRLLDLGCGPGDHLRAWQSAGFHVSGLDVSPTMLENAAKNSNAGRQEDVALYCADVRDVKSLGSLYERFDWVVSHFNFINLFAPDELDLVFAGVSTLLTRGGLFAADISFGELTPGDLDQSPFRIADNCNFLGGDIDLNRRRIDREWNVVGNRFRETYWLHSQDCTVVAALKHQLDLARLLPWMSLQNDSFETHQPGAGQEIIIFAKR